ncbi:TRAF3-interacting protein 1-like [Panicum miliaceum]|uniref:TRAF3-interacting protein 1-like n=1 Tax=Panicum miliaceum TaxID=4540 RepID=A0A3L6SE87_PANMI|nr:TRAF3-interacting protein 1-like [Panicum miliaceum]
MGEEKKAAAKDGGDKKKEKDAGAAPAGPQPIVLKVDLHCAGCAGKVRKAIKRAPGVESVTADMAAGKVVVTGPADATELKERIEARAKKPVQIVSAGAGPPKKDKEKEKKADGGGDKKPDKEKGGGGGDKKADKEKAGGGGEKKAEKDKGGDKPKEEKKAKEPKEETVTLKIRLHCDGCIDRIKRRIYKIKGVKDVAIDAGKDLVKVTGTMDAAALPGYLRDKLSRTVDPAGAASASVAPMPMADAGMYQMPPHYGAGGQYPPPPPPAYPYGASHLHAPQMFSDENPNACSVM